MPDLKDAYGEVDRYRLFYDSRTGKYHWYPAKYATHPVFGEYLTLQTVTPPSSTVPRPMGMHGIGTRRYDKIKSKFVVKKKTT